MFINHIHGQNKEVCLVAKVKQVKKVVKLQIPAAKANPAPPVGPALVANSMIKLQAWLDT